MTYDQRMISEPSPGSVVRFTKSRRYTYVCYRIQDDPTWDDPTPWYTTSSFDTWYDRDARYPQLGKEASWADIVHFAEDDPIEVATRWKTLPEFE